MRASATSEKLNIFFFIQTVKEERDINLTLLNSSKHEMNEKISQLKFSVERSKVENSLAIKEISEKLASI